MARGMEWRVPQQRWEATAPMKVVITGSTGLIGSALGPFLEGHGMAVARVRRAAPGSPIDATRWDPAGAGLSPAALDGADAVVHLSGAGIADRRWTTARKEVLRASRMTSTRLVAEAVARARTVPRVLVCASAVGFYGNRGDEVLGEMAAPGTGFLAELCREWEAAADPARQRGVRVVFLRSGIALSAAGGALGKMLLPFKAGVGGVLGSGRQYMSWIAIDDLVRVVEHALTSEALDGPVNVATPRAATNREFTSTLGAVLRRPTVLPMPALVVRLFFGALGVETLLSSTRVEPVRLIDTGFEFRYPGLEGALRHVLGPDS